MTPATSDFRTGSEILHERSDPVELLNRIEKLSADMLRLQRWNQQLHARICRLEDHVSWVTGSPRVASKAQRGRDLAP